MPALSSRVFSMHRLMLSKAITVNESRNDGLISLSIIKENEIKFHPFYRSPNAAFLAQLKEESNTTAHSFLCIILKQGA